MDTVKQVKNPIAALLLIGAFCLVTVPVWADDISARLRVGLNLVSTFAQARDGAQKIAEVWMVYVDDVDSHSITYLQRRFSERGARLRIRPIALDQLHAERPGQPVLLVPAQPMNEVQLAQLLEFARQWKILSYSPYEGDVERGVLGGVQVTDRILPLVNLHELDALNIQLKAFFYKVAAKYAH